MMSAEAYRARTEAVAKMADTSVSYDLILEAELLMGQWRGLGVLAQWQDAMLSALASNEDETMTALGSSEP